MQVEEKLKTLEEEITALHTVLEGRGINSRGATDIFGRPFSLPVNAEHKATVFNAFTLLSVAQPHMRGKPPTTSMPLPVHAMLILWRTAQLFLTTPSFAVFWAATFGFFCTFFSVFAPSALGPYLKKPREDGGLDLDPETLSTAGNLAVSGTIVMRVIAGSMCDLFGVRRTFIFLLLVAIPGMIILMTADGSAGFILGRFIIGLSLATFVTCQVWCSQFFDRRIVGQVNATAGGWGNVGGGITLLVMPEIMAMFLEVADEGKTEGEKIDWAWRMCFIIPIAMHLLASLFIMTGRDLADGSYSELETSGAKQKAGKSKILNGLGLAAVGFSNTNALIMMLTYGLCFGVELTMNNKLTLFFNRYYAQPPKTASQLGACFSLMNLFARSWGGILSDYVAVKGGIRARITAMWVIQSLEGIFCIVLGILTFNMKSPDDHFFHGAAKVQGQYVDDSGYNSVVYTLNGSQYALKPCASDYITPPRWVECDGVPCELLVKGYITIKDPNPDCIHNGTTLGPCIILILVFSLFVQMAEGLHFGIVPYICRPALGVVSGMVGAGGNLGALISGQFIIGSGAQEPLDRGFVYLGIVIISLSMLMHCIFFPGEGGILLPKSFPYDPQWVKPPANSAGADELKFDAVVSTTSEKNPENSSV